MVGAVVGGGRRRDSDWSVIAVLRAGDGKPRVAAQWRGHTDHDLLTWKAAAIATYYNRALLVFESNTLETEAPDQGEYILHELYEHYANLYEIDDELAVKSMILPKKMITKLTKALGCDGFNIVQNNGEVAGQTVFHFHMHLIPRYNGDQAGITWKPGELKDEVRDEIVAKVTAALM